MAGEYKVSAAVQQVYEKLKAVAAVQAGIEFLAADHPQTIKEQIAINQVSAPPFQETQRALYYLQRLQEAGLADVRQDSEGNVFGVYKGTGAGPRIFVSAHLDTVFAEGTDVTVQEKSGRLYAPGIADNARGLAAILSVIRALRQTGITTVGDIIFGGNVGEEGLGDLRGIKAFFREQTDIDGYIAVDGVKEQIITYLATGSRRYEITYRGPGGHSWNAFGLPSAIHALGRAIAKVGDIRTPSQPKTTFTVGTITGGTSVNSIAADASMLLDLRSASEPELKKLETEVMELLQAAAVEENARWGSEAIQVEIKLVGDRPAGQQSPDLPIVQAAWAASAAVDIPPEFGPASSTDANLPMSLGIPAIRLCGGGAEGNNHSLDEWYDPTNGYRGPQKIFMTLLGLVGVAGVSEPLLPKLK
jgi:acetylornithine deacetylase/succinyl-diaminopimelate desuccinylase-like protein